ncbi:MAG: pyridoxal-phosphate dependent enzyme [Chromatiales bacterium]|nr:pyridoxal-phosphate dependent enzyme [Chromatiales bacterium]
MPVGGGGLIAGIAAYIKRLRPEITDHRRRAGGLPTPWRARCKAGRARDARRTSDIFADGVAVQQVGEETFRLCRAAASTRWCCVDNDEICAAIKDIFEDTRSILEPAGRAGARRRSRRCARAQHRLQGQDAGGRSPPAPT